MRLSSLRSVTLRLCLSIFAIVFLLLFLELVSTAVVFLGWLKDDPPMITFLPPGTDDWRHAHITADASRESDPILWWRSKPIPPYTTQRFRGPLVAVPKPNRTLRIIAYGDSNTDGTLKDSWPERLQQIVDQNQSLIGMKCEVLNAGVAGYSSHQGLLRLKQEISKYQPDIILVAFGWNDAAEAIQSDSSFQVPSHTVVSIERVLIRFRFYRLMKHYMKPNPVPASKKVPRVSINDYVKNLKQFCLEAREHGATAVLITRPHREPVNDLRASPTFMRRVPEYNVTLLRLCMNMNHPSFIDAEDYFLENHAAEDWADECHFTDTGRIKMAKYVFSELQRFKLVRSNARLRSAGST